MKILSIACYYPWVYLRSGVERIIVETIRRSRHRWTIYTNYYALGDTFHEFSQLEVVVLSRVSVNRKYFQVALSALTVIKQLLPMKKHDVLLVHSEGIGDFITFRNHQKPVVCYCHTPLKVINDLIAKAEYIKKNKHKAVLLHLFGKIFMAIDRMAWNNYSYVFCNSETVRGRIVKAKLAKKEEVEILHPGVDCNSMIPSGRYEKYFLALTRIKWWKNVELAIEGFKKFQQLCPRVSSDFRLIVAGQVDKGSRGYFRELCRMAMPFKNIIFIQNPSAAEVRALYSLCYAVLNTTLNEDWGIVPLEANAFGKPVIAVNQGGPKESQIDGETCYLVEPKPEAFGNAMARLAIDERLVRSMAQSARENASRYSWSNFVDRIDTVLEEIVM